MSLMMRRRRREAGLAPSGGGGETQIAFDSTSLHPDAWVSDDFNYADTAAWLSAVRAKPTYDIGSERSPAAFTIDSGSTFGGHPTLLVGATASGPYFGFNAPSASQVQWSRTGVRVGANFGQPYSMDFLGFVDDAVTYSLDGGVLYAPSTDRWVEHSNGGIIATQPEAELYNSDLIVVQKVQRVAPASFALTVWVNGTKLAATANHAAYNSYSGLGFAFLTASQFAGQRYLFYEAVSGDGLTLPPYTGLEDP